MPLTVTVTVWLLRIVRVALEALGAQQHEDLYEHPLQLRMSKC